MFLAPEDEEAEIADADRAGIPGPKGSMMKLMVTATHKALSEIVGEIMGWVFSIAGGTNEIQREITTDRVLGLPKAR